MKIEAAIIFTSHASHALLSALIQRFVFSFQTSKHAHLRQTSLNTLLKDRHLDLHATMC